MSLDPCGGFVSGHCAESPCEDEGLAGEDIPLMARIICVADSYDAMTSNRSYREPMSQERVRTEIIKGRGSQFDPRFADIMIQMIDEDIEYTMREK